jgi:Divergent InlB B-repeat domain
MGVMMMHFISGLVLLFSSALAFGGVEYRFDQTVDDRSGLINLTLSSGGSIYSNDDLPEPFNPLYFTLNTNSPDVQYIGASGILSWPFAQVYLTPYDGSTHIEVIIRSNGITIGNNLLSLQFMAKGSGTFSPTVPLFLVNSKPVPLKGPFPISYDIKSYYLLSVSKSGLGNIVSSPDGINCGTISCSSEYKDGTEIMLDATPEEGFKFTGWNGDCSGVSPCVITINGPKNVSATFTAKPSAPVDVVATAGNQKAIVSWGASKGEVNTYTARLVGDTQAGDKSCTATSPVATCEVAGLENGRKYRFAVVADGPGGTSDQSPLSNAVIPAEKSMAGVCGTANGVITDVAPNPADLCLAGYAMTPVQDGKKVYSWACDGAGGGASINCRTGGPLPVYPEPAAMLSVKIKGKNPQTKTGIVKSDPFGVDCGIRCDYRFTKGAKITLAVTPQDGAKFDGWSGACSNKKLTCTFKLRKNLRVTAKFK